MVKLWTAILVLVFKSEFKISRPARKTKWIRWYGHLRKWCIVYSFYEELFCNQIYRTRTYRDPRLPWGRRLVASTNAWSLRETGSAGYRYVLVSIWRIIFEEKEFDVLLMRLLHRPQYRLLKLAVTVSRECQKYTSRLYLLSCLMN